MMKRIITTAIWTTIFLLVVGGIGPAQAEKVIKVGIVDCYSGPPSTYTNDVRDYVIDNGTIRYHGTRRDLAENEEVRRRYLSV
ncbi:MAG: hypothetical protein PVG81_08130 [Desulfobacterales bacterium]|jgi:hypothetical protein